MAASSGLCDIVKLLIESGIDADHKDEYGRGVRQLAEACSGIHQTFPKWLEDHAKDAQGNPLEMTYAKGRKKEDRSRGKFGQNVRKAMSISKGKGSKPTVKGQKGEGFEPTGKGQKSDEGKGQKSNKGEGENGDKGKGKGKGKFVSVW